MSTASVHSAFPAHYSADVEWSCLSWSLWRTLLTRPYLEALTPKTWPEATGNLTAALENGQPLRDGLFSSRMPIQMDAAENVLTKMCPHMKEARKHKGGQRVVNKRLLRHGKANCILLYLSPLNCWYRHNEPKLTSIFKKGNMQRKDCCCCWNVSACVCTNMSPLLGQRSTVWMKGRLSRPTVQVKCWL